FQEAINQNIDSIMTAHVHFPAIESEPEIPATLSEKVLNGLLREEMNFQGVIITDCMEMSAIADSSGTVEGAVKTLQAGSDLVLISHTYEKQVQAIQGVIKAVKESRISEKSIDESLKRILELKEKRIGLDSERFDKNMKKNKLNPELNREIAQKIAEKGITLAKGEELIPVKNIENKDIAVINFESSVNSQVEDDTNYNNIFTERLSSGTNSVTSFSVNEEKPLSSQTEEKILQNDLVVVLTHNAVNNPDQIKIAENLSEDLPVIVVALRNPYDLRLIENTPAFISTYDYSPANLRAAADLISGKIESTGKLPVTIQ
ncbi:MAG: glycoside hydrolase family 3 N-terminal domain-containing protein, partial [Halanaerobiaceae bacterium]